MSGCGPVKDPGFARMLLSEVPLAVGKRKRGGGGCECPGAGLFLASVAAGDW